MLFTGAAALFGLLPVLAWPLLRPQEPLGSSSAVDSDRSGHWRGSPTWLAGAVLLDLRAGSEWNARRAEKQKRHYRRFLLVAVVFFVAVVILAFVRLWVGDPAEMP